MQFRTVERTWFPALLFVVAVSFVLGALTFKSDPARFPLAVGCLTAALALVDLLLRLFDGSERRLDAIAQDIPRAALIGCWFALTLALFYWIGVIAGILSSATIYHLLFIARQVVRAGLFGAAHAVMFWLVFEQMAGFHLHRGVLN